MLSSIKYQVIESQVKAKNFKAKKSCYDPRTFLHLSFLLSEDFFSLLNNATLSFDIVMYCCPVCQDEELVFVTVRELRTHITNHVKNGSRFRYPLRCSQSNCRKAFENIDSFVKHVNQNHSTEFGNVTSSSARTQNAVGNFEDTDFISDSPSAEENFMDVDYDYDRPVENKSYEQCMLGLALKCFSNSSIPQFFVTEVLNEFSSFLCILRKNIVDICKGDEFPIEDRANCLNLISTELDRAVNALESIDTAYKIKETLYKHPSFVEPQSVVLGYRRNPILRNGECVDNREIKEESFYIPIPDTVKAIFSDVDVAELIVNENDEQVPPGTYKSFKQGSNYLNNALFRDKTKISLKIQIFYDGMGTTNSLRGHSPIHNVGMYYYTLQNLDTHFNTCFPNVHLLAICYSVDIKKYGFRSILSRLMEDIKTLETTGIKVDIPGRGEVNIFGSIAQFSGDCLAMNEIFGFICDFSHDYHCTMCYCTKNSMQSFFKEENFNLRSKTLHTLDVEEQKNSDRLHIRGVKENSVLNDSLYFNVAENRMIDLMHIFPEGVIPYIIGCVLFEYINVRKLLSIQELNFRISWLFAISEVDKGNTPAELNAMKEPGGGLSPKLTANEVMAVFRYFPLILAEFVDTKEDDKHWALLMQLQTITDLAFAPKLTDSLLNYFSELYEEHLILFQKLYPNLPIKPKQHYLVHFKTIVQTNGPPTFSSCFKYELRNSFFKRISHTVCNFKNIPKTLSYRNQLASLCHTIQKSRLRNRCVPTHKLTPSTINTHIASRVLSARLSLREESVIHTCFKIKVWGRRYSVGNIVVLGRCLTERELQFGKICTVIWLRKTKSVFFLIKKMKTVGLCSDLNVYLVKIPDDMDLSNFACVSVSEITIP